MSGLRDISVTRQLIKEPPCRAPSYRPGREGMLHRNTDPDATRMASRKADANRHALHLEPVHDLARIVASVLGLESKARRKTAHRPISGRNDRDHLLDSALARDIDEVAHQ